MTNRNRFSGSAGLGYIGIAHNSLAKRTEGLLNGTIKPYRLSDYCILNPEIVETIFNRLK